MWVENDHGNFINLNLAHELYTWDVVHGWCIAADFQGSDTQYFSLSKTQKECKRKLDSIIMELNK